MLRTFFPGKSLHRDDHWPGKNFGQVLGSYRKEEHGQFPRCAALVYC